MLAPIRSLPTTAPRIPAGGATPPNPYAATPVAYQPAPVAYQPTAVNMTPTGQPTVANGLGQVVDNLMSLVGKVFTGIINFFKKLFGGNTATTTTPATTLPTVPTLPGTTAVVPTVPGAIAPVGQLGELTGQDAALAQQQGILPTKANLAAFMAEAQALEQQQALGPGSTDTASITELQNLLKQWGYQVNVTGQFDQATIAAVLKFKADNNLFASYQMANGQRGIHPFIDNATKQAMLAKLQGRPVQPAVPGIASVNPASVSPVGPVPMPAPAPVLPQPQPIVAQPQPISIASVPSVPVAPLAPPTPPAPPPAPPVAPPPPPAPPAPPPPAPAPVPAPAPAPVMPAPTPAAITPTPVAGTLTADEQRIAQQQGILATRENFDAFMREAQTIEAGKVLGPGSVDPQSVNELQGLLRQWGYAVNPTGQWDQATTDAVIKFKKDNNLPATYKLADGTQAYHPFIDDATKQAMLRKLQGVAPAPSPVAPAAVAGALTADQQRIADQQGIQATPANFQAFMTEAQALESTNALGPGTANTQSVLELQNLLKQWGYNVNPSGQWDQPTTDAVLNFKRAAGLRASYVLKDGTPAFHPFIDEATKQAMIRKIQGA